MTVSVSSCGALAQSFTGGGQGGSIDGVVLGGEGGGRVHWGGQGGGAAPLGPTTAATPGEGGKGAYPAGASSSGGGDGGGIGATVNNPGDIVAWPVKGGDGQPVGPFPIDGTYGGGGGGAGLIVNAATYTVSGGVVGGYGGIAGRIRTIASASPGGGGGGAGLIFNGQVLNIAAGFTVNGGNGGYIFTPQSPGQKAAGGGGGAGLILLSGTVNNDGEILGGGGGKVDGDIAASGAAGAGVYMAANTVLNNRYRISGGGTNYTGEALQPAVIMDGDNILLANIGPQAVILSNVTDLSRPGIWSKGNGNRIVNGGTINASTAGPSVILNAVEFHGNGNTMELWGGWDIDRRVIADGTGNHLVLGGADAGAIDLSAIGPSGGSTQFQGFADYTKNGASTWTVTGVLADTGPWTLEQGTLALTGDADMLAASRVTVDATLDISGIDAASTTMKNVSGNANGRIVLGGKTLALEADTPQTFAGIASGDGGIDIDRGTQIFTGDNTYTGLTTIASGATLRLGANTATGSIAGDAAVDGDLIFDRTADLTYGGDITGSGTIHQTDSGKLILTGDGSAFAGMTTIDAHTALQIGNGGTSGNLGGTVAVDGALSFDRSDTWAMAGTLRGGGAIAQNGSGRTRLTGDDSGFTGLATINNGALVADGTLGGAIALASGRLEGTGTVGSVTSTARGTVAPGDGGFGTLTVSGDYRTDGGTVEIAAALAGDNSPTSRLAVTGSTAGTGTVHVINRNGLGAQTAKGIEIISVGGQSNAAFTLRSDFITKDGRPAVVAGAYAYSLYKGQPAKADGNWYLRSELTNPPPPPPPPPPPQPPKPHYNPGTPVYEGGMQNMRQLNRLPTLQQRVGNRYWDGAANPLIVQGDGPGLAEGAPSPESGPVIDGNGVWARIERGYSHLRPQGATTALRQTVNTGVIQAGIDGLFYDGESGRIVGGMTGLYGRANSDVVSPHGDGTAGTQAWGLGGTLTWYGENGFYADGQAHVNWFDNDYQSRTAMRELADGRNAVGYALGAELGRRIAIDPNWSVTPQAQLVWSTLRMDAFRDVWDAPVSLKDGDSLTGRLGASLDYRNAWHDSEGQLVRTNVYAIANIYQDFLRNASVEVAGTRFTTRQDRTWGGLGFGGTYAWNDDRYAVYGEGAVDTSLNHFARSYDVRGTLGFRVKW